MLKLTSATWYQLMMWLQKHNCIITAYHQFEFEIWIRHLAVLGGLRHAGHRLTDVDKRDQRLALSTALPVPFLNEANCLQQASSAMLLIHQDHQKIFGSQIFGIVAASATSPWIKTSCMRCWKNVCHENSKPLFTPEHLGQRLVSHRLIVWNWFPFKKPSNLK